MSRNYDNWERLVAAAIKKQQFRAMALAPPSTDTSFSSTQSTHTVTSFASSNRHHDLAVENRATGTVVAPTIARAYSRGKKQQDHFFDVPSEVYLGHLKRFSLRELQLATSNFSNENIIGWGSSGKVYKGRLEDGTLVAVKRLRDEHSQYRDQEAEAQFQTEVETVSMAVHRNLQKLSGFCVTPTESLLVYPFMANGCVASCLRGRPEFHPPLDWSVRKRIAVGSAEGLAYLHEHCDRKIIHCDFKASHIMLDEDFEAVVGDFGLAILMDPWDTNVTTAVRGTSGHICPEYLSTGKVSEKTDVFGYGIMLLELITGQRAFDLARLANDEDVMLLDWVNGLMKEKKLEMLVDAGLKGSYIDEEVDHLIQVALLCANGSSNERPNMSDVVRMLRGVGFVSSNRHDQFGVGTSATGAIAGVAASTIARAYNPRKKQQDHFFDIPVEFYLAHLRRFSLDELQAATNNFSNENIIGSGGCCKVYKGRFADGALLSVRRLQEQNTQDGELQFQSEVETRFQTEVQAISTVSHRNLQRLHGFCMTPTERLLVYSYMANGSVASCLRGRPESQPPLDWPVRKRIALGTAGGLAYLHEHCDPKIIHRDIKAANIFLDDDFEAVVGDFGLAILMDHKDTHVTTDVRGTGGYICPEYLHTGNVSDKVDVFGYGIMLLELITGQKVFDLARFAKDEEVMLLDWVKDQFLREKKLEMLVDTDLKGNYIEEEVGQLIRVSLLCTQSSQVERPTMSDVVRMLQGDGLSKQWQEDIFWQEFSHAHYSDVDWILSDTSDNKQGEELSSPR